MTGIQVGEDMPIGIVRVMDEDLEHLALIVVVFLRFDQVIHVPDGFTKFPGVVLQNLDFPIHGSMGLKGAPWRWRELVRGKPAVKPGYVRDLPNPRYLAGLIARHRQLDSRFRFERPPESPFRHLAPGLQTGQPRLQIRREQRRQYEAKPPRNRTPAQVAFHAPSDDRPAASGRTHHA